MLFSSISFFSLAETSEKCVKLWKGKGYHKQRELKIKGISETKTLCKFKTFFKELKVTRELIFSKNQKNNILPTTFVGMGLEDFCVYSVPIENDMDCALGYFEKIAAIKKEKIRKLPLSNFKLLN